MAGISISFSNVLELTGALYPLFIICFIVIASIFNLTLIKGLTYLGGITFCYTLWMLICVLFNSHRTNAALTCNLLSLPGYNYSIPSIPVIISWFTLTYLVAPMIETSLINPAVITVMMILSSITMYYQLQNNCSTIFGITLSAILGIIFGLIWFGIFWISGKKDLLFYNELVSNNVVCNKPKKQTFKCSVYKNGEIISSNIV